MNAKPGLENEPFRIPKPGDELAPGVYLINRTTRQVSTDWLDLILKVFLAISLLGIIGGIILGIIGGILLEIRGG